MTHEANLAWDLVERNRQRLTAEEADFAFVHLGAGDYVPVIRCVLTAVLRDGAALDGDMAAELYPWSHRNTRDSDLSSMIVDIIGATAG